MHETLHRNRAAVKPVTRCFQDHCLLFQLFDPVDQPPVVWRRFYAAVVFEFLTWLGISEFHAEVKPQDKLLPVEKLQQAGKVVVRYPITGRLLSPMIAALAMCLSSVSVITKALHLRK